MTQESRGERIAKWLGRTGVASRRDAERMIEEGRVKLNNQPVTHPATFVTSSDLVQVDGKVVEQPQRTRLWRYHKPDGLVTTHKDPEGRPTVFASLPEGMPRVISVGRLDLNSEGLLLLTNDGELARRLELRPTAGCAATVSACLVWWMRPGWPHWPKAACLTAYGTGRLKPDLIPAKGTMPG